MPQSRHTSALGSPSKRQATKQRRSCTTELAFHGIHTSRLQKSEKCNPCVRYEMSPMSRAAQERRELLPPLRHSSSVHPADIGNRLLPRIMGGSPCAETGLRPINTALMLP